jgi:hypothetical protein
MMNHINKILILLIILFLINHLTNGKILETIKSYFNVCKEKFTNMYNTQQIPYAKQLDFPYINQNDPENLDEESYMLNKFIESRVTKNSYEYEMTANRDEQHEVLADMKRYIMESLSTMFNSSGYKFDNIKILDRMYYYENPKGKDIVPFKFSADISYKNNKMGSVLIHVESYIYEEYKGGIYAITNTRLIGRKNPNQKKEEVKKNIYRVNKKINFNSNDIAEMKQREQAKNDNKKLNDKLTESFNDVFITPPVNANNMEEDGDEDEDFIPNVRFTEDYEIDSITFSSDNK